MSGTCPTYRAYFHNFGLRDFKAEEEATGQNRFLRSMVRVGRDLFDGDLPLGGQRLLRRLECSNSVDGCTRDLLYLPWLRCVRANAMVFGKTKVELRRVHHQLLDGEFIPEVIHESLDGRWHLVFHSGTLAHWSNAARVMTGQGWVKAQTCSWPTEIGALPPVGAKQV